MRLIKKAMKSIAGLAVLAASVITSPAQQPGTAVADRPSAQIAGHVINRGGDPISGAVVYVLALGGGSVPRNVVADSSGSFKAEVENSGLYRVWAILPGFTLDIDPITDDLPHYYHAGESVTLTMIKGGVITGKVTTAANEPVVGAAVRLSRVRDEFGEQRLAIVAPRERFTDDRGVYRFYGLLPGTYVISAGGASRFFGMATLNAYDSDAPTYAPSSTRDTAAEITVGNGEEVTADIQYRGEAGHAISGTLTGLVPSANQTAGIGSVRLLDVRNRADVGATPVNPLGNYAFSFYGVPDGEYELTGNQFVSAGNALVSEAKRIKVQGADVTGINLTLAPLGSIEGRLVLESDPKTNCARRRDGAMQETIVYGRRFESETKTPADAPLSNPNAWLEAVPDANGVFSLRNLRGGSYWVEPRMPSAAWYLRSITLGPANTTRVSNVPRDGITLKSGERQSGLNITITEGAAIVSGQIKVSAGQILPAALSVFLVPAEKGATDSVLRFFEARAGGDGTFAVGSIVPGRYRLFARVIDETDPLKPKRIRQNTFLRTQIVKDSEAEKNEITLQPCQQLSNYELEYQPAPVVPKPRP